MPHIIMLSIEWLNYIMQHFTVHLLATKIREFKLLGKNRYYSLMTAALEGILQSGF